MIGHSSSPIVPRKVAEMGRRDEELGEVDRASRPSYARSRRLRSFIAGSTNLRLKTSR